jgi:hypothetical protein
MDISLPGIGSIHDVTLEQVLLPKALLSISVSCLFVPMDCWFITFENVGYRTMFEYKMLCIGTTFTLKMLKFYFVTELQSYILLAVPGMRCNASRKPPSRSTSHEVR